MSKRIKTSETKIRTPQSEVVEHGFSENLSDLRLLVAKEYNTIIFGESDMKEFHHMGVQKIRRSLSERDARFFESFIHMCIQIVWIALGRKALQQIELEVNRILKSNIFHLVEHKLDTHYNVMLGRCISHDTKLNARSPLIHEVFCNRDLDYRLMGLGVIKSTEVNPRLEYLKNAIEGPEEMLVQQGVTVGIIGIPRSRFDTLLKPLPPHAKDHKLSKVSLTSTLSWTFRRKSHRQVTEKVYPDIVLPEREPIISSLGGGYYYQGISHKIYYFVIYLTMQIPQSCFLNGGRQHCWRQQLLDDASPWKYFPPVFEVRSDKTKPCNEVQLNLWQKRLRRLSNLQTNH